ncbi:MAG: glycoside hydrolase family 10 protein [Blastocatellia bacterium]
MLRGPRKFLLIVCAYFVALLSAMLPLQRAAAPETSGKPAELAPAPVNEVRAMWVVRTSMTTPEAVTGMVGRAHEAGITDLLVQVRGRGDAYYNSRWEPRADSLAAAAPDFDPLRLTTQLAHQQGMKVHAWINTYLVADAKELPVNRQHAIYAHPDWLAVPRQLAFELYKGNPKAANYSERLISFTQANGAELEGLFLSPAHPAVREQIYNIWIDVLEKYEVDGLHFDYVRYPNPQFDYCRTAVERFRADLEKSLDAKERARLAQLAEDDPLIYVSAYPDRYAQFQRDQVTELVERIYTGVKARKPAAVVSAAVFSNSSDAYEKRFQDWRQWMRRGIIDVACPMAYWTNLDGFNEQIESAVRNQYGGQVWAGVGSWMLPLEGTLARISSGRRLGATGFVLYSYNGAITPSEYNPGADYLTRVRDRLQLLAAPAAN